MASITASGIGSGLDVTGLVSQLMSVESQPLTKLATKEASYQAKISAYGTIQSALSSLQSALKPLTSAANFAVPKASSSDSSIISATASSTAPTGTHTVEVTSLAQSQRVASSATAEPTVAPGSLTITFGTYTTSGGTTTFAPSSGDPKTIDLASGSTLEELRDAINDADAGVTASVVDNGTAKQLIISGNSDGAAQAFQLSGSGGLSGFSYDASTSATSSFSSIQSAQDAQLTLDGISATRSSNLAIDDLIDGVSLTLNKASVGTKVTVSVSSDNSAATSAVNAFVKSYNELNTTLTQLTAYDTANKTASTLTGDSTVRSIEGQLRSLIGNNVTGANGVSFLSELGISFQKDGTLAVDSSKLSAALNDPNKDVATFFAGSDSVTGWASKLNDRLSSMLDSDGGLLAARTDGLRASIKSVENQYDTMTQRLTQIQARYTAQFTALDSLISQMNSTSTYLTQQLANLPKISSS